MKKGFTLIELLAVIIILAVIALIATPIVLNTIDDAKNSARESKLRLYADSVKLKATNTYFTNAGDIDGSINTIDIDNSSTSCDNACYSQGKVFLENCSVDEALGYYYINGNIYNNIEDYEFALGENEYSKCSPLEDNLITSIPTATGGSVALASTTYDNKNYDKENKYLTF